MPTKKILASILLGGVCKMPDGKIDIARLRPLARMGYQDYASVGEIFEITPQGENAANLIAGMGGEAKGKQIE